MGRGRDLSHFFPPLEPQSKSLRGEGRTVRLSPTKSAPGRLASRASPPTLQPAPRKGRGGRGDRGYSQRAPTMCPRTARKLPALLLPLLLVLLLVLLATVPAAGKVSAGRRHSHLGAFQPPPARAPCWRPCRVGAVAAGSTQVARPAAWGRE